ncbi:MAG: hypothetical protein OEU36_16115 [Gammaproteobacteria bacterium]|nr:hypothetical protein [Gammaproteobacteria bacterium]
MVQHPRMDAEEFHTKGSKWRRLLGSFAAVAAAFLMVWLLLGIADILPLPSGNLGSSGVRLLGEAAAAALLLAAFGFWEG